MECVRTAKVIKIDLRALQMMLNLLARHHFHLQTNKLFVVYEN